MFSMLWFTFFYQPLFNALIWIYSNIADQNLGWAVIWLTVFLRIVLLPLTILSESSDQRRETAEAEAALAIKAYKNDRVAQQEVVRKIMKKYKVSPWAKALSVGVQAVIFLLLYQVFVGGITGDKMMKNLYPSVDFPGRVNVSFYGFDIGHTHDYIWAGIVALYLLGSIVIETRAKKAWNKSEMYYFIFFPLATFALLWYLPMVKSLFILTTMIFSDVISLLRHAFFKKKAPAEAHGSSHH
jgi:membrane protein insertase Oxa1/YidC/SpoIIIJ